MENKLEKSIKSLTYCGVIIHNRSFIFELLKIKVIFNVFKEEDERLYEWLLR